MKTPFRTFNETDETGVAEPEIPTEELDEYVELEQPSIFKIIIINLKLSY